MLRLSWRAWLHQGAPRAGPWWMGHVWTVAFGLGVAAVLSVVTLAASSAATRAIWPTFVAANVIISLAITFAVRLAFWLGRRAVGAGRLAAWSPSRRSLYFTFVSIAGVAVGWPLGMVLAGRLDERFMAPLVRPGLLGSSIVVALFVTALFQQFFRTKARQIAAENAASEAQLRLLQAQIEPHFLFNTLASIDQLIQTDPPRASKMQQSLIRYLRSAMPQMRETQRPTLGQQIDLSCAFLEIMAIRMEERLTTVIEVPEGLKSALFPSMMLQTLVENAIKHGLEPKAAGGRLAIRAEVVDAQLAVHVIDNGVGFNPTGDGGVGLANIRERLKALYDGRAELIIAVPPEGGTSATIKVPYEIAPR